jgi:hypothetical protein
MFRHMKRWIAIGLLLGLLALASTAGFSEPIGRVLGVEAGYGYLTQGSSALLSSLYYGYLLGDKPNSQTLLSLALGYTWFPGAVSGSDLRAVLSPALLSLGVTALDAAFLGGV